MLCESCEQEIALNALTCPHCGVRTAWGREVKREPYLKAVFVAVAVIMLAGIFFLIKTHAVAGPH